MLIEDTVAQQKPQRPIKYRPDTFERANWRVNDFLAWFGIGRTKFYELVKSGDIKIIKCGRTTLVSHSEATAYQHRLEGGA